ncbi:hypothetical protein Dolphis_106 [Pseudomonas phage Dolphis]|nr:hypothetical protein Dolphis_106 [Pseudomonas phage Dolphis]
MGEHTQGLLHVGGNGKIIYDNNGWGVASATVHHSRQEPGTSETNARRLVACWNACEGITEAELSHGPVLPLHRHSSLVAQRDELLAILTSLMTPSVESSPVAWHDAKRRARAAIAKAKAEQPSAEHFTSITKGGTYERLGAIRGAGQLKGLAGIAYRDVKTGGLFIRTPECFAARMKKVEGGAA